MSCIFTWGKENHDEIGILNKSNTLFIDKKEKNIILEATIIHYK